MLNQEMSHALSNLIAIYSGNHYFCSISQIILHKVFCFALSAFFSSQPILFYVRRTFHKIRLPRKSWTSRTDTWICSQRKLWCEDPQEHLWEEKLELADASLNFVAKDEPHGFLLQIPPQQKSWLCVWLYHWWWRWRVQHEAAPVHCQGSPIMMSVAGCWLVWSPTGMDPHPGLLLFQP